MDNPPHTGDGDSVASLADVAELVAAYDRVFAAIANEVPVLRITTVTD